MCAARVWPDFNVAVGEYVVTNLRKVWTHMLRTWLAASVVLAIAGLSPANARAYTLIESFPGGSIPADWLVTFQNATDWSYDISNGVLTATDIAAIFQNQGDNGSYATVQLEHSLPALQDYTVSATIGWDSEGSNRPIQSVSVATYSASGALLGLVRFDDAWVLHAGQKVGAVGSGVVATGADSVPGTGTALIQIVAVDGLTAVKWGGSVLLTGATNAPAARLVVTFGYYSYASGLETSFFGSESITGISVTSPVPEPGGLAMFTLGGLLLAGVRRRLRLA